jgi:DNA-binding NarL/FixJ family response regulator
MALAGMMGLSTSDKSLYPVSTVLAFIITCCLFFLFTRRTVRNPLDKSTGFVVFASLLAIGGLALLRVADRGLGQGSFFVVVGAAALGSAFAMLLLLWLSVLKHFSYRGSYLFILSSHAIATVLCALSMFAPPSLLAFIMLGSLLVAGVCGLVAGEPDEVRFSCVALARPLASSLWHGVLGVCIFAFVAGIMARATGRTIVDQPSIQGFTLLASALVLTVMAVPALVSRQPLRLENSYRVALPLSALGFLIIPFLIGQLPSAISGILATTGYMVVGIVMYCSIADIAKTASVPAAPLFALCEGIALSFYLLGVIGGYPLSYLLADNHPGFAVVGLAVLYLAVIGGSTLLGAAKDRRQRQRAEPNIADVVVAQEGGTDEEASCERSISFADVATTKGLSTREQEVLSLLLRGRTLSRIGEELFLSTSAVKYHTQSLYRKFNTRSREGLLQAFGSQTAARVAVPSADHINAKLLLLAERFSLTERETEALSLLAFGKTVSAITQDLGITENTAKTHIKRAYAKLGVHSKQEMIDLIEEAYSRW